MSILSFDKFLDDDELAALEREIYEEPIDRNKILVQLALETGARASELLAVRRKDLVEGKVKGKVYRAVRIYGLKGSNDREIPISSGLFSRLKGLEDPFFDISYMRLYQIWAGFAPRKAGGKRLKTFHCLRHTCAVNLYRKTKDVKLVQAVLGHRDLRNTMVYVDFVYSQDEMRRKLGR